MTFFDPYVKMKTRDFLNGKEFFMSFHKLEAYISGCLCGENKLHGCEIMISQNHQTLYSKQFGDVSSNHYLLYSCTKPLTVAGAMRLVESGRLSLDAPVFEYLPFFNNVFLEQEGKHIPPQHPITVRHLLTMSAGFDYSFEKTPITKLFDGTSGHISTVEFAKAAVQSPLLFEPGERFQYSICHDLLGAVIEAVSGMSFADYQKQEITEPLGMHNTGFLVHQKPNWRIAPLYQYNSDTKALDKLDCIFRHGLYDRYESGGAGMVSTLADYASFADAMACGGTAKNGYRLLRPETVDLIRSEQLESFTLNSQFSCAAGNGYSYGLGVRTLVSQADGQKSPIGEFGWDGAAGSYVLMDPKNKLSIVFTTHLLNWPAQFGTMHAPIRDLTYDALEAL